MLNKRYQSTTTQVKNTVQITDSKTQSKCETESNDRDTVP
jgi:hypothetical protein